MAFLKDPNVRQTGFDRMLSQRGRPGNKITPNRIGNFKWQLKRMCSVPPLKCQSADPFAIITCVRVIMGRDRYCVSFIIMARQNLILSLAERRRKRKTLGASLADIEI